MILLPICYDNNDDGKHNLAKGNGKWTKHMPRFPFPFFVVGALRYSCYFLHMFSNNNVLSLKNN